MPQFYFRHHYSDYLTNHSQLKQQVELVKIVRLTSWRLKVVNISGTGYYAPTLEPLFQQSLTTTTLHLHHLSCILYEPVVKQMMEQLRLKEWRLKNLRPSSGSQTNLLYHNLKGKKQVERVPTKILALDKKGSIL